ncbi:MAG: hypothetical protein MJ157_03770 [Clostridia bacterium]|nr:hypothetical protein [Clostridia bacterium]
MNTSEVEIVSASAIRARVRLDFKGIGKRNRVFKNRSTEKAAEDARDQNLAMFRNIPIQGIYIQDVDIGLDIYLIYDELYNTEVAYAPIILDLVAASMENLVAFFAREEFRKIEILSRSTVTMQRFEVERLMCKIYDELKNYRISLERRYNLR